MYSIKVTNTLCGRVDFHESLSREIVEWIALDPNLLVEVVEVLTRKNKHEDSK
jgi:hypothetical protein